MSPFVSKAQQRWGNSPAGQKALGGKDKVAEWNGATKSAIPERKGPTKEQKSKAKLVRGMKGKKK